MTDANLMDAECVHGTVWHDCLVCANFDEAQVRVQLNEGHDVFVFSEGGKPIGRITKDNGDGSFDMEIWDEEWATRIQSDFSIKEDIHD